MVAAKIFFERIWNKINDLSRRPSSVELGFRPAEVKDINFIFAEIIEGAEAGHYNKNLLLPPRRKAVETMLQHVIEHGHFAQESPYGVMEVFKGKLWVFGSSKLGHVGYCLMAQKTDEETEALEILKLGVIKQHQNNGYGKQIISCCTTILAKNRKLSARCYPQSERAYRILLGCGFKHADTNPNGTRKLLYEPLN